MPRPRIDRDVEARFTNHITDFIRSEKLSQQEYDELIQLATEHVQRLYYTDGMIK